MSDLYHDSIDIRSIESVSMRYNNFFHCWDCKVQWILSVRKAGAFDYCPICGRSLKPYKVTKE
jgi:hypothetical protein